MSQTRILKTIAVVLALLIASSAVQGRALFDAEDMKDPYVSTTADGPLFGIGFHNVGLIAMSVINNGTFGLGFAPGVSLDFCTGERALDCEYPKGSNTQYLFASCIWIGAVVGRDTLVSVGGDGWQQDREMYPNPEGFGGGITCRSIVDPTAPEFEGAISEQDYIAVYTDTWTSGPGVRQNIDFIDGRPHIPLNIEITQRTFAWSYDYADDFVLFDYSIRNIGNKRLTDVYMGVYVDADVGHTAVANLHEDDICGFVFDAPSPPQFSGGCPFRDTVFIAWIADNDGDLELGQGASTGGGAPVPNVTGTRIVRTPSDSLDVTFNWWVSNGNSAYDFGPRYKTDTRDLRTGGQGTPEGDRNKYWFMRNGEFDYDQAFVGTISPTDTLWKQPTFLAPDIGNGYDTRYLLSFGPFNIDPGQQLPISLAHVGGLGFHTVENNLDNLPNNPERFYENLTFDRLTENATWASWVYDNPGIDSDNNGYRGKQRICVTSADTVFDTTNVGPPVEVDTLVDVLVADSIWYEGDGVPDFQGASPPPAPFVYLDPSQGKIRVRWNGYLTETTRDAFSQIVDFEGYRVWYGRDDRKESFQLAISYDIQDYNKYFFNASLSPEPGWDLKETPFTLEELHDAYGGIVGDSTFDPLVYTQSNPLQVDDSILYFAPQDFNVSGLGAPGGIKKVYGDTISFPSNLDPDFAQPHELTPEGNLKYFEYEYTIEDLLPTVQYYVSVTAFDFGSPSSGLQALETSQTLNSRASFALPDWDAVQAEDLQVYIYPNPYRIDGGYLEDNYELPIAGQTNPKRLRRIHFANLPPKCRIKIFSLDGDLVRQIDHDADPNDPNAAHDTWDVITRNTQAAVSGLYYWVVEEDNGETQMGKLMIIK